MKKLDFSDNNILERSIVISASAGSGKTFTLSVFVLLTLGRMEARPYEIFATTFSEASAADLRERLLRPLDLLASLDLCDWQKLLPINDDFAKKLKSLNISPTLSKSVAELSQAAPYFGKQTWMDSAEVAQSFWRKTRREAELMHVSTIHSIALGLLRTANGPPDRILEADHPELLRVLRQAVRAVLLVPEDHPDFEASDALMKWAERNWGEISKKHDTHRDAMGHFRGKTVKEARQDMHLALIKAEDIFGPYADNPNLALDLSSKSKHHFKPEKILSLPKQGSTFSEQIRWAEKQCKAINEQADDLPGYYSTNFKDAYQIMSEIASAWEAYLGGILINALSDFETLKKERGLATFGDIVRSALEGLNDGSIAPPRPKLLLVDEYQDTSVVQDGFLGALGAGRIIRVGDVKQAIYGFRGGISDILLGRIAENKETAYRLPHNFRSAPPIVDMANYFVKSIWSDTDNPITQIDADQIARASGDSPVGAVLVESKLTGTDLPAFSPWISGLSGESGWEAVIGSNFAPIKNVTATDSSSHTSASTKALLLRQRTKLSELLIYLKKCKLHPYVLAKDGFWDSPGIRLVMAALESVAHPGRSLPSVVLLRHLVGLCDSELHKIMPFKNIEHLDVEQIAEDKRPRIAWLKSLKTMSTQTLAATLLIQGNLLAIVTSLDKHGAMEPLRARRNLAGFLAMLRELPSNPVTAFAHLDELRNGIVKGDMPASGQDADLIIQTVHASKGLEYDDVILPLLKTTKNSMKTGHFMTDGESRSLILAWKFGGVEPGKDYKKASDLIAKQVRRDDLNSFYVAITRAKKRLCLLIQTPEVKKQKKETKKKKSDYEKPTFIPWSELGMKILEGHPNLKEIKDTPPKAQPRQRTQPVPCRPKTIITPIGNPPKSPVTDTTFEHRHSEHNLRARQEGERMHAYLQNLLVRWEDTQAFDQVLNNPPSISNAKEIATRFLNTLETKGWRHLRRRTEMNLVDVSQQGGKGRADLVIWDKETIHIVDFKHIHKLNKDDSVIYAQQLNRYALALGKQNTLIQGWLVLLKSGEWRKIKID